MARDRVEIHTPTIRLDALLKFAAIVGTGGAAKGLIQAGAVRVNGQSEIHRGRQVKPGDVIELLDEDGTVLVALEVVSPAS